MIFGPSWVHGTASDTLSPYKGAGAGIISKVTASLRDMPDHVLAAPVG